MDKVLSNFSEKERSKAYERYKIIKPFLEGESTIIIISDKSGFSKRTLSR